MRLTFLLCILFGNTICFANWTPVNTGIADNFNDIHFRDANFGVIAGNKGVYYTVNNGNNWTRYSIPGNAADNDLYNRCKFLSIAGEGSYRTWICGYDTVNNKAVILSFKMDDQAYSFLYIGNAGSQLHAIRWNSNILYAVGNAGLIYRYNLSNNTSIIYTAPTSLNLRSVAVDNFSNIYLGGENIYIKATASATTISSIVTISVTDTLRSLQLDNFIYAAGQKKMYKIPANNPAGISEMTYFKGGPINARKIFKASPSNSLFIPTDHGIFQRFGDMLERQVSSIDYDLNAISIINNSTTGFACGNNGLILKTANGGATIPYLSAYLVTGCQYDYVVVSRPIGGSGITCFVKVFNASNVEVFNNVLNSCTGSSMYPWYTTGSYTMRYILSNGTYTDTVFMPFTIPPVPAINLPVSLSDSILCKNEKVLITINNTEAGINYILKKHGNNQNYGTGAGTGASISFLSESINVTGDYFIQAGTGGCVKDFSDTIKIVVEHPKGRLSSQYINSFINEPVTFNAISNESQFFTWKFDNSSTPSVVNGKTVQVSFNSTGEKFVELISWSANGCYDTTQLKATRVVTETGLTDNCYNIPVPGVDVMYNYVTPPMKLQGDMKVVADGILTSGSAYQYILSSKAGDSIGRTDFGGLFVAKYSHKGVLRWNWHSRHLDYVCPPCNPYYTSKPVMISIQPQADNSIVMTGNDWSESWTYFNSGDSIQLTGLNGSTGNPEYRGFITKVNAVGSIIWSGSFTRGYIKIAKQDKFGNTWLLVNRSFELNYRKNGGSAVSIVNTGYPIPDIADVLVKISPSGDFISAARIEHDVTAIPEYDVEIDNDGNCWITGEMPLHSFLYNSNGTLAATISRQGHVGAASLFLAKYNADCNYMFHINGAVLRNNNESYNRMWGSKLALDSSNNIYLLGMAGGTENDSISLVHSNGTQVKTSLGGFFLTKLNMAGEHVWTVGSKYNSYFVDGFSLFTTADGVHLTAGITVNGFAPFEGQITSTDGNAFGLKINYSSFLYANYDLQGVLRKFSQSNTPENGSLRPVKSQLHDQKLYIAGETSTGNGGGTSYTLFGQNLSSQGSDAFLIVLNNQFCDAANIPTANAGPDKSTCSGAPVSIGTSPISGNLYSWTSSPEGFSSGKADPLVTPHVSTTYYLTVINQTGLIARDTIQVNITGAVALAGMDVLKCNNNNVNIGGNSTGTNFSWTSSPAGFTSSIASPVVNPTITTSYYLEVTDGSSCTGRDTVIVKLGTTPSVNAGPDANICSTTTALLGTSSQSSVIYTWSPTTGLNSPHQPTTLAGPDQNITYTLTAKHSSGCVASDQVLVNVTQIDTPSITAGGPTTFCNGLSVLLTSSEGSGNQWYRNNSLISGATSATYTATLEGNYSVKFTSGSCTSLASNQIPVVILELPPVPLITPSGTTNLCPGEFVVLVSSAPNNNTWLLNGVAIPGANSSVYTANAAGNYSVRVTNATCNVSSGTKLVVLNPTPPTPAITATGSVICSGETLLLTSSASVGNIWSLNGIPLASYAQQLPATTSGSYTVKQNLNGCNSQPSLPFVLTVNFKPPPPTIIPAGPTTVCPGGTLVMASTNVNGNQWFLNNSAITGATSQMYTASIAGSYTVNTTSGNCTSVNSAPVIMSFSSGQVTPVITPTGATTFCSGDSVILSSSAPNSNQWYRNGTAINGANGQVYVAKLPGSYTVQVVTGNCNSQVSASVSVTINNFPPTPAISQNGNVLMSSSATGNQWYLAGTSINGATAQQYIPSINGIYTVTVTVNGCSTTSTPYNYLSTGINSPQLDALLLIAPNPVQDKLFIRYDGGNAKHSLLILDVNGRQLKKMNFTSTCEINMIGYAKGSYIVQVVNLKTGEMVNRVILKL